MALCGKSALRSAALTLLVGAAVTAPLSALASPFGIRLGGYATLREPSRMVTNKVGWLAGVQMDIGGVPSLLNGEGWRTNLTADFTYRKFNGEYKGIPISLNQVYDFEEQDGKVPYAGFGITLNTYKTTIDGATMPWVTRVGLGLILGVKWTDKISLEGRYDIYKVQDWGTPDQFRFAIGYKF